MTTPNKLNEFNHAEDPPLPLPEGRGSSDVYHVPRDGGTA